MNALFFDIRTAIFLLFIGNLLAVLLMTTYKSSMRKDRYYRRFLQGKLLQSLAWALLLLRGQIPDLFSVYIGNTLLLGGFALEAMAMANSSNNTSRMEWTFAIIAGCCTVAFWAWADTPAQRVALASMATAILFGTAAAVILRPPTPSALCRAIGYSYVLFCLALSFRAYFAEIAPSEFGLMSGHLVQTLAFLVAFMFMLVSGNGFLLLLKERNDQQLLQTHQELAEREALLSQILDTSSVAIFLVDKVGRITHANQHMSEMFGYPLKELIGSEYVDHIHPSERETGREKMLALLDSAIPSVDLERIYLRKDSTEFWGHLTGKRLHNAQNEDYGLVGVIADITKQKKTEEKIREMALYDALTGLANRTLLSDRLQQAITQAKRNQGRFALLYLDLDLFKTINDTLGHDAGDLLLKEAATRIRNCVRESDTVARIGGDEFVVLLGTLEQKQHTLIVAEKIREALCLPVDFSGQRLAISSSIGIAFYPDHGDNETSMLKSADSAMYWAKNNGRNSVCIFGESG